MRIDLFSFALLIQLGLCIIISTSAAQSTEGATESLVTGTSELPVTADEASKKDQDTPTQAPVSTSSSVNVTQASDKSADVGSTDVKSTDASTTGAPAVTTQRVTTVKAGKGTHKKPVKTNKETKKSKKIAAHSGSDDADVAEMDDENVEDEEMMQSAGRSRPKVTSRKVFRENYRNARRHDGSAASWRTAPRTTVSPSRDAGSDKNEGGSFTKKPIPAGDKCEDVINCIGNYLDTDALCCKNPGAQGECPPCPEGGPRPAPLPPGEANRQPDGNNPGSNPNPGYPGGNPNNNYPGGNPNNNYPGGNPNNNYPGGNPGFNPNNNNPGNNPNNNYPGNNPGNNPYPNPNPNPNPGYPGGNPPFNPNPNPNPGYPGGNPGNNPYPNPNPNPNPGYPGGNPPFNPNPSYPGGNPNPNPGYPGYNPNPLPAPENLQRPGDCQCTCDDQSRYTIDKNRLLSFGRPANGNGAATRGFWDPMPPLWG